MNTIFFIIFFIGFIVSIFYVLKTIFQKIKKNEVAYKATLRKTFIALGITLGGLVLALATAPEVDPTEIAQTEQEVEAEEPASAPVEEESEEDKAKVEAERKAKEEAEAKEEEERKAKEEAEAKAAEEEAARIKAETLESLKLSGTGDSGTDRFTLEEGFVIIESTHQGGGHFAVELLDSNGNQVELAANTVGNYSGAQAYVVDGGEYLYNVSADGAWTISMSQYMPEESEILNGSASGSGDGVFFMNIDSGARNIKSTHNGEGHFAILINDSALIANDVGVYEGSQIQQFQDSAAYMFTVSADGDWTVTVE